MLKRLRKRLFPKNAPMQTSFEDNFVPMINAQGDVIGMMGKNIQAYQESSGPLPTQASLDAVLAQMTYFDVVGCDISKAREGEFRFEKKLTVTDDEALAKLRSALVINETLESAHWLVAGSYQLELYGQKKQLAIIELADHDLIRWDAWHGDAYLRNPQLLQNLFAELSVPGW